MNVGECSRSEKASGSIVATQVAKISEYELPTGNMRYVGDAFGCFEPPGDSVVRRRYSLKLTLDCLGSRALNPPRSVAFRHSHREWAAQLCFCFYSFH